MVSCRKRGASGERGPPARERGRFRERSMNWSALRADYGRGRIWLQWQQVRSLLSVPVLPQIVSYILSFWTTLFSEPKTRDARDAKRNAGHHWDRERLDGVHRFALAIVLA